MTEKVIFEFRVLNEDGGVKYEIQQGTKKYTRSGRIFPMCLPLSNNPCSKTWPNLHRKFIHRSQKQVRKSLDALEKMYTDFYGDKESAKESNPS